MYHYPLIASDPKFTIRWKRPNLPDELGEYFENDYTKSFFKDYGIAFQTNQELLNFLNTGHLVQLDRNDLKHFDNLTLSTEDFQTELADPDYAESFHSMENALLDQKTLTLPAPILIKFDDLYYGYAGNRRVNLAWKYGIPVKFWVVGIKDYQ
jgi:hypothetical protein